MEIKKGKMTGLGRGLGALLTDSMPEVVEKKVTEAGPSAINEVPLDKILTNPFQPRTHFDQTALEELSESIKVQGIIQPITVRLQPDGFFQLISGERRTQASRLAGLSTIPAYVRLANDQQMLEMALIENIQRENLNAMEVALSYQRLMHECSLREEDLGERVGKNRSTVNNYIRLLKLPIEVQNHISTGNLSMGHARAIITIENPETQISLAESALANGWSVRQMEDAARAILNPTLPADKAKLSINTKIEMKNLQKMLSQKFGTKVAVKLDDAAKGEFKISFGTRDEMEKILSRF